MAKDNLIRVRVKGTEPRNGEIKKFKPMNEIPVPGTMIGDGNCYGMATQLEMSIYQNTRDEDKLPLYDFYRIDILDSRLIRCDIGYICIPHKPSNDISIYMYDALVKMAQECDTEEDFINEALNSDLWETYDVSRDGRKPYLKQMYVAVHRTIADIIKEKKLSQIRLAKTFGIPRRTIENWCYVAAPPVYISLMLQECLGLYTRE